jgi:dipeptidyl aminopeptidase/acylaminoacyl peptidase
MTSAPYGTWVSPVTVELMTASAVGLGAVSVDGDTLYWLEMRPGEGGRTVLCRRRSDGTIEEPVPAPFDIGSRVHEYGGGAYRASGGLVVFSERKTNTVWIVEPSAEPRQIATPAGCRYADFEIDHSRRRLIAIREDHRDRPPTDPKAAIVALPLDPEGTEDVLFEGPDFLSSPRLSTGGDKLAFIAWDHPNMPWDATRLHVGTVSAAGGLKTGEPLVGATDPEAIVQPCWSPAGDLYFSSDRTGWWNLYRLRDGTVEPIAPIAAEIGGPHWVFRQNFFAHLPDGRIAAAMVDKGIRTAVLIDDGKIAPLDISQIQMGQIQTGRVQTGQVQMVQVQMVQVQDCPQPLGPGLAYIATPPDAPPSLQIIATIGAFPQVVRRSAPAAVPESLISPGEPITFPTEGGEAHAFWYPPRNQNTEAAPGELPPLVVLSHGGPTSMTTNGFSLFVQYWTTRGFGVVDVNYGGSTGFGRAYRCRLDGQWGIVDVADCIAAATYLVERGLVDPKRLAIRGGSAGGYTTLAALTSTNVFKAGASLYGVADLMLLAHETHKFESRYLDRLVGELPQARALYDERSPINHLDRLDCPIIFFQGIEDKTVPPSQAEAMVSAMKARHLPVAHYTFEGEGHGFRKPETLRRVLELELDFYGRVFGFSPPGLGERVSIADKASG